MKLTGSSDVLKVHTIWRTQALCYLAEWLASQNIIVLEEFQGGYLRGAHAFAELLERPSEMIVVLLVRLQWSSFNLSQMVGAHASLIGKGTGIYCLVGIIQSGQSLVSHILLSSSTNPHRNQKAAKDLLAVVPPH